LTWNGIELKTFYVASIVMRSSEDFFRNNHDWFIYIYIYIYIYLTISQLVLDEHKQLT